MAKPVICEINSSNFVRDQAANVLLFAMRAGWVLVLSSASTSRHDFLTKMLMDSGTNVFLVEDDALDQEFFIAALSRIDNTHLVNVAKNGKEAIATLERSNTLPSVIFMDVDMPLMNGIECLKSILLNPKTRNIPVVMLTSTADQLVRTARIGARAFIVKPDDEPTLVLKIRQAMAAVCQMIYK